MSSEPAVPNARSSILERIRQARIAGAPTPPNTADPGRAQSAELWTTIERSYRRSASRDRDAILALFEHRLLDYDAHIERCASIDLPAVIERLLSARGAHRMLTPAGIPAAWLPASIPFTSATGLTTATLDRFDGVLTGATLAIAETGTLVLQSVPGQGPRAATLVPDYHLCVVYSRDVVETVPEAIARLRPAATLPTTFISGPSATADIEMTRIKGVHGPRFLDVILLD